MRNRILSIILGQWLWLGLPVRNTIWGKQSVLKFGGISSRDSPAKAARPKADLSIATAARVREPAGLGDTETGLLAHPVQTVLEPHEGGPLDPNAGRN